MDPLVTPPRPQSRRRFLQGSVALAGSLLAGCGIGPPPARPGNVRRIGHLTDSYDTQLDVFRDGLRQLGYVEGENLSIEFRFARGDNARYPALIAELVGLGVECIVCGGVPASIPAKQADVPIPLVAWLVVYDAVDVGLVANIARPEGNMTGVAGVSGLEFHSKVLETLKETIPEAGRVAVLGHARFPNLDVVLDGVKGAARRLGLQLEIALVQDADGIEPAFRALSAAGAQAVMMLTSTIFLPMKAQLASLALAHRLPLISTDSELPKAGGLLAYSPNRSDIARRVAWYVDKILKGTKPADLPMERPSKFDLVLNLKTAQALGLTIPQSILSQSTEVIQ